jgi:signal peptidase I
MSDSRGTAQPALGGGHDAHPGTDASAREGARLVRLLLIASLGVALLFGVVRPFIGDVFTIASDSMSPTLEEGDRIVVNKLAYRVGDPDRGDLVAFREPDRGDATAVKRVVGVGGDRIAIHDGLLVVNGTRQDEPYVDRAEVDSQFFGPETVPEGSVFLLGDNRADSRDSRRYGAVPEDELLGEVLTGL